MARITKFFNQRIKGQLERQYGPLKKVTVMGLGLHGGGLSAVYFFNQLGIKVVVTDLKKEKDLKESLKKVRHLKNIEFVLGQHRNIDFINADLIIKNPAVPHNSPYLKIAAKHKIPIESDIGLFFELCRAPIIGVTGTKGKSTTTALIAHFLKLKYSDVILAGNLRRPVLDVLDKINFKTKVILELSSWQLEDMKKHQKSPHIAIITNIMPDHLNSYSNFKQYVSAKKLIFKFQKPNDYLIVNNNDSLLKQISPQAKSKVVFFNRQKVEGWKTFFYGEHNLDNLAAALEVAKLFKIPEKKIKNSLKRFKNLEGRMEVVAKIKGITFINDTTATIPEAAIAGLSSLINNKNSTAKIILIAGGADKNLDFKKFAEFIIQKAEANEIKKVILLTGTATEKIKAEISKYNSKLDFIKETNSMEKAVKQAKSVAQKGDIVLLSPGAASFGLFAHEFERGEKFNQAVFKFFS